MPVNFSISAQADSLSDTTITFTWDPPPGTGVETIVDMYVLSIYPFPQSHPGGIDTTSQSLEMMLEYNLKYSATLVAVNCAGKSSPVVLPNLEFSKYQRRLHAYCNSHAGHF